MNALQVYAAYIAPVALVLIGIVIRAWSSHRIAHARDRAVKAKA